MNKDVKKLWVEELRSGIPQTTGVLADVKGGVVKGECCLGVLCRLAVENGVDLVVRDEGMGGRRVRTYDYETHVMPEAVMEWAGMEDRVGLINTDSTLAIHNDNGKSFDEIADIIESNF